MIYRSRAEPGLLWSNRPPAVKAKVGDDLCFTTLTDRVQSVQVWSFVQKCHDCVINKGSAPRWTFTAGGVRGEKKVVTDRIDGWRRRKSAKKAKGVILELWRPWRWWFIHEISHTAVEQVSVMVDSVSSLPQWLWPAALSSTLMHVTSAGASADKHRPSGFRQVRTDPAQMLSVLLCLRRENSFFLFSFTQDGQGSRSVLRFPHRRC